MRLGFVADFHGNYTATLALEKALKKYNIDKLFCLGDVVGKGPSSDKTMDWALKNCDIIIGGNWDYGLGNKSFPADNFYWEQLGEKRLETLRNLAPEYIYSHNGINIRMLHGRPIIPELMNSTTSNAEFEKLLTFNYTTANAEDGIFSKKYDIVVYADIHRQLLRTVNFGHIVNCGSVGNALGVPRVCFAIIDIFEDGEYSINLVSVPYDRQEAIKEAENMENMPLKSVYIEEISTGKYARSKGNISILKKL